MDTDLLFAIGHHLAVFTLVGALTAEFAVLRPGMAGHQVTRLAQLDGIYGAAAAAAVLMGVMRVYWGDAGPDYYLGNHAFWGKMAAFAVVGVLSISPTLTFVRWQRLLRTDASFQPSEAEVQKQRRFLHVELAVLILVPVFAAMMARGYGA